jgi:hypothetical protein
MYRRFNNVSNFINGYLWEPCKDLVTFVQMLKYTPTIVMCIQYAILLALFKDPHKLELFTKF